MELNIATVFSGIGAFEHALERLDIDYNLVFACDNGDIELSNDQDEIEDTLNKLETYQEKREYIKYLYDNQKKTNFVKKSYLANYDIDESKYFYDVKYLDGTEFENQVDVLVGGSPCQSFSMVGKRGGFNDTRGTLFYEYARLVSEIKPSVFIYENVKGLLSHDNGNTWTIMQNVFDELGYNWSFKVMNAKDYGVPQSRERVFVVGFKDTDIEFDFPERLELKTTMQDYLIDNVSEKYYLGTKGINFVTSAKNLGKKYTQINGEIALCQKSNQQFNWHGDFIYEPIKTEYGEEVDEKYYLSDKLVKYVMSSGTKGFYSKPEIDLKVARPLLSSMVKMHRAGVDNYVTTHGKIRKLTPRECLRLMGFCDSFEIAVSDTQMYKQAGNSIVVDVLMRLFEKIFETDVFNENDKLNQLTLF